MMEKQLMPAGYKQTEVGVIPEDWETKKLGEIGQFKNGINKDAESFGHGTPFVNLMDVFGKPAINGHENFGLLDATENDLKEYGLKKGDVLFIRSSVKPSGVGLTSVIKADLADTVYSGFLIRYRSNDLLDIGFKEHCFYQSGFRKRIIAASSVSANTNINQESLKDIVLVIPTFIEQTAIANALSDVDALIAVLEKLINKKSAIKTAAMQQLLTGKKRLPPFDQLNTGYKQTELGEIPGDWEVIDFGDLFQPTITRKPIKQDMLVSFVGMQDVSESAQLISPNIISYNEVKSGFTYFEKNDVLVAKITPCFENGKGCIAEKLETNIGFGSTEFHVLRANEKAVAKYIYFITTTGKFRKQLESEMVGSAGHRRVPMIAIEKYRIPCSNHIEEQTAIATVLSDMDKDLEVLQQRLHKTQQIKQGMMQELLTGKTRLVQGVTI